ncbi:MAG: hypothetical protein HC902_11685 [Calothrix sp. SM1_5_4]|nr:hypothetical protein [Calothrix sp. SM1_5_4]
MLPLFALNEAHIPRLRRTLEEFAETAGMRGLCLLGREGINLTVSGSTEVLARFKERLCDWLQVPDLEFKDSTNDKHPFHVFKVKIKDEIVTIGRVDLVPDSPFNSHLTPAQWHEAIQDPNTIVIDTRNDYEVEIGKFKTATDFKIKEFRDFPRAVAESGIANGQKSSDLLHRRHSL